MVAGYGTETLRNEITDATVRILGAQEDLRPLYERARVFVVPTRFAAGLPFKAHEAAGLGSANGGLSLNREPIAMDPQHRLFCRRRLDQMAEYCVRLYGDEKLWELFRANSLARVKSELSPAAFAERLHLILKEVTVTSLHRSGPVQA